MKKLISLFVLSLLFTVGVAQTVTVTFTGRDTNNQYVKLDKVVIDNVTKNWQETITYPDTILMMGGVGIKDYDNAYGFALFQNNPNPFDGTTYASLRTSENGKVTIGLLDVNGRIVETLCATSLQPGIHQFRIQVANAGTYLLTARQNGKTSSVKMVNNGKGAMNKIEYQNYVEKVCTPSLSTKSTKGTSNNPFDKGDEMTYTGSATVNGTEYQSQIVRQNQQESEEITLQFAIATALALPTVTTDPVSNITAVSATCGGNVTNDGGAEITERGVCYSTKFEPTIADTKVTATGTTGTFTCDLTGLQAGTSYYVRAYATNSEGTAYGEEVKFTTSVTLPTVVTGTVSNIKETTATCGGEVTSDGGATLMEHGVCYDTVSNPTVANMKVEAKGTVKTFTCNLAGLAPSTTYYVRAYANNSEGTAYGEVVSFTTEKEKVYGAPCPGVATVTDHEGNVYNTVLIGTQCWTKESMRCTTSPSTGTKILTVDDPGSNQTYVGKKAYYVGGDANNTEVYGVLYNWLAAVDTFNTQYGETAVDNNRDHALVVNFGNIKRRGICPSGWHVPTDAEWTQLTDYLKTQREYVCTESANIAKSLASTKGWKGYENECAVGNDQSSNNATGFSAFPAGSCTDKFNTLGEGAKFWSTTLYRGNGAYHLELLANSATVRNAGGTWAYSLSVRCLKDNDAEITPPTVKTAAVSSITEQSATVESEVISDGGTEVTARGVCWSLIENPTVAKDNFTTDGSGTGSFTSNITGLEQGTVYYVRAYATNSMGTAYGEQIRFKTMKTDIDGQPCPNAATVSDHEGNVYNTVLIGKQCWTKENMRCKTSPSTGTALLDTAARECSYAGKQAYYANGDSANTALYGLLYNWCAAVDTFNTAYEETAIKTEIYDAPIAYFTGNRRGICPEGWHMPSNSEWTQLIDYVSDESSFVCGDNKMNIAKALASEAGWNIEGVEEVCAPGNNTNPNNATGFSAVPAGGHGEEYEFFGVVAGFWSATQNQLGSAYARYVIGLGADVAINGGIMSYCYSVRCVKD